MVSTKNTSTLLFCAQLIVAVLQSPALSAQERPDCSVDIAFATNEKGTFLYVEDTPSGQNSDGRLELVRNGQTIWSIATSRGCSLGISVCNLVLGYTREDGMQGSIDFDMSFGRVKPEGGEAVCVTVMSQMAERLGYLHRRYSDQDIVFSPGRPDAPVLLMDDYLKGVPSVFQRCAC